MHTIHGKRGLLGARLIIFDSLPSTNQWVLDNAENLRNGDVVQAVVQTAGRGRFSRDWFSRPGRCLTVSIVVIPESIDASFGPIICMSAALAVRAMLEKYQILASLKWPNDVLVDGRKICGILAETANVTSANSPGSNLSVIGLGIGLNVNMDESDFAAHELVQPATSMSMKLDRQLAIEEVLTSMLSELGTLFVRHGINGISGSAMVEAWKPHDFLAGRRIHVSGQDCAYEGGYAGIDEEGRLCMVDDAGEHRFFWSGDVSVRDCK